MYSLKDPSSLIVVLIWLDSPISIVIHPNHSLPFHNYYTLFDIPFLKLLTTNKENNTAINLFSG